MSFLDQLGVFLELGKDMPLFSTFISMCEGKKTPADVLKKMRKETPEDFEAVLSSMSVVWGRIVQDLAKLREEYL